MPKVKLEAGAQFDFLNKDELSGVLDERDKKIAEAEAAHARAVKWMRLPETLVGTATNNSITLSETTGHVLGPYSGYAWIFRRLVVTGLTTGATPDVVNFYRGSPTGPILWQLNGNSFGSTFGKMELVLVGGETLAMASTGTFASTNTIIVSGELVECPVEMLGKLAA